MSFKGMRLITIRVGASVFYPESLVFEPVKGYANSRRIATKLLLADPEVIEPHRSASLVAKVWHNYHARSGFIGSSPTPGSSESG